ncbi:hypothetical protein PLA106_08690 [Pseudomonas amygdali pv. lachrymans str. M302278]|nr:hypothetical protein PLA106_08690 [Pseudomonas amygdali pv. lachrymans str. M302278]
MFYAEQTLVTHASNQASIVLTLQRIQDRTRSVQNVVTTQGVVTITM